MDPELQAIREARLQELKSRQAGDKRSTGESVQQFLEPQALERLSRVALVKPDRAQAVENYLMQMVARGVVRSKISEQQIVGILNGIARDEQKRKETKIIFNRREHVAETATYDSGNSSEDDFLD
ncbi:Sdd2p Ecym_7249 [Eremothecium cymbalariae DBVPG|uniref:Programmed cell death protein 5 n=1 Tax=Eremothecium cymbalariae (strain CBS 270.75 / DBVPG 7215 / KCTC 17166 / NRRL Y-17582) TaxID=931890 RepID=G8JW78_ERECY|nr:hypothetical protein Ecym_7249 [Eremothecium cymbalariae DBVPG\